MTALWEPYKGRGPVRPTASDSVHSALGRARSLQDDPGDLENRRSDGKMKGAPGGQDPMRRATFVGTREAATP